MEDPPDSEPGNQAPAWVFYSLWPRMPDGPATDEDAAQQGEARVYVLTNG